jgi:hypothetical protein
MKKRCTPSYGQLYPEDKNRSTISYWRRVYSWSIDDVQLGLNQKYPSLIKYYSYHLDILTLNRIIDDALVEIIHTHWLLWSLQAAESLEEYPTLH